MKKLWLIGCAWATITACNPAGNNTEVSTDLVQNPATASTASGVEENQGAPVMTFEETARDFGTITQGEKVKKTFRFKNTGDANLLISAASSSCGCTVPEWPKHPIAPGESGEVVVAFSSDNKVGRQHKKVFIVANTNPSKNTVAISGNVIGPAEKE